ncbi:hypothetical protein MHYP_G00150220 [Metynnis hypsauchen]
MVDLASIDKYVTELKQKSKDCEFGGSENDMIRDKIVFRVNDQHLKERLLREPKYFHPAKQLVIQADASKDGLGAWLLQEVQPIAYVSRALTSTEKNYAQTEKELLAIVYSDKKFHQYVYGVK